MATTGTLQIGHIINLIPSKKIKGVLKQYQVEKGNYDYLSRSYLETEGDLDELHSLIIDSIMFCNSTRDSNIKILEHFLIITGTLWTTLSANEFTQLRAFKRFQEEYPKLARTLLIWGWS